MNYEKVIVIIPTYNEALVIEKTVTQIFKAVQSTTKDIHILIFDSHSTDDTDKIVRYLQKTYKKLHLQTEPQKSGLGSAYQQAMRYALTHLTADIVVEFDADLSHQPKYIVPMLDKLDHYDVIVGSRYVIGGSIPKNWAWYRKLLSISGNCVARLLLTPAYKDLTSGFRMTRRQALQAALPTSFISNHYAYKLQLLWLLHKNKTRIYEYPIDFIDRQQGISKLPTNSIFDSLRVLFILRFQESTRYFKMSLVGVSGLLIQCITYNILRFNLSLLNAAQLAIVAAMFNNFLLNDRFTFKERASNHYPQKLKAITFFIGYSILMIVLQSYWLKLTSQYFGGSIIKENILMLLGAFISSLINYITYSRLIWPRKKTVLQKI
jgi:dolichol-phosphate mannosyltransferase